MRATPTPAASWSSTWCRTWPCWCWGEKDKKRTGEMKLSEVRRLWNSLHHLAMLQPHRGSITFYDLRDVLDDLIGIEKGVENETLCIEEHKEPLGLDMEGYVDLVQVRFHDGEPHDFRGT